MLLIMNHSVGFFEDSIASTLVRTTRTDLWMHVFTSVNLEYQEQMALLNDEKKDGASYTRTLYFSV